jgi:hypothetical protein
MMWIWWEGIQGRGLKVSPRLSGTGLEHKPPAMLARPFSPEKKGTFPSKKKTKKLVLTKDIITV